jgi:hypothetical protein
VVAKCNLSSLCCASLRADEHNARYLEIKILCGKRFQDLSPLSHSQATSLKHIIDLTVNYYNNGLVAVVAAALLLAVLCCVCSLCGLCVVCVVCVVCVLCV